VAKNVGLLVIAGGEAKTFFGVDVNYRSSNHCCSSK
jgi:hypothetical protein